MRVAELFVSLGIKGADKTAGALSGIRTRMKDLTSTSLEAKAGIIGMMYGLERLMSSSAQVGTGLTQFEVLTGKSADQLQRWQYLALKSGESADEMTSSIQSVQNAMTKMVLGQGAPSGMTALSNVVGFDPAKARDTFYVMDKLREYARATKDIPDVGNEILKSFGISDHTIEALRTSNVDLNKIPAGHAYSDAQRKRLNDVNIGWSLLGDKIEHSFGKMNAKFGPQLIGDISRLADQVLRMVDAFTELAEKLKVIQLIGESFKGWTEIFSSVTDVINQFEGKKTNKEHILPGLHQLQDTMKLLIGQGAPTPEFARHSSHNTSNVNINVTAHGMGADEIGKSVEKHVSKHFSKTVNDAYRQLPRGGQ